MTSKDIDSYILALHYFSNYSLTALTKVISLPHRKSEKM